MKELKNLNSLNNKKLLVVVPVNKINDVYLNECFYSLAQQTYKIDLLVLTNGLDEDQSKMLESIISNPTVSVFSKNEEENTEAKNITSENKLNYTIESTDNNSFASIFNDAFNYAVVNGYKFYSVVECEDVLDQNWYLNFDKYSTSKAEHHGFLPLSREISNGNFIGFFNEASWMEGLAEVSGTFDLQLMMRYNCMNVGGAVFNVESIKQYSEVDGDGRYKPMKENIKISFIYEFFLRMIYNDLKFFSIPRMGYEHRIDFVTDYYNTFSSKIPKDLLNKSAENGGMLQEEYKFWSDSAKKEYFFDEQRNIEYKPLK